MTLGVRVIKVGGSLLDWPGLASNFRRWLAMQPTAGDALIVGGGGLVDKLRELDQSHSLPPAAAHWLAVRCMSLTAAIVAQLLPEATLVNSLEQLRTTEPDGPQVFDAERFLRQEHGSPDALPESWEVTSDSIAARVAKVLQARELVLLKSSLPAGPASRESLARLGYVDRYFPRASRGLIVRAIDLRNPDFPQAILG
jgi:aspartokinase-like uncharacterized kinase